MTDLDPVSNSSDRHSFVTYPNTENNTILNGHSPTIQGTKDAVVGSKNPKIPFLRQSLPKLTTAGAQAAFDTVQNHPLTQNTKDMVTNVKDNIGNAPVAENVKAGYANTQADFHSLAHSRTTPPQPTAAGQPLTAYHSFFYHLLSWKNPRATLVSFITVIFAILAFRYLSIARWVFKCLYVVLGTTAAAELAGRLTISHGLASQFRPRRYYTIPRETVDAIFDELHELLNFFVLEFQRILYAENVLHTIAAFAASFLGYWLIKIVPLWGLTLMATSVAFLMPLIYISNQEIIDSQVQNVTDMINKQTAQVKDIAGQHTARATETAKAYASDLSSKAQQYVGSATGRSASPEAKHPASIMTPGPNAPTTPSKPKTTAKNTSSQTPVYTDADFPAAPKEEFASSQTATHSYDEEKPLVAS